MYIIPAYTVRADSETGMSWMSRREVRMLGVGESRRSVGPLSGCSIIFPYQTAFFLILEFSDVLRS